MKWLIIAEWEKRVFEKIELAHQISIDERRKPILDLIERLLMILSSTAPDSEIKSPDFALISLHTRNRANASQPFTIEDMIHEIQLLRETVLDVLQSQDEIDTGDLRIIKSYFDLYERKVAASSVQAPAIFEAVKEHAILRMDPSGKIIDWNSGAEAIFGYRAEEILGRNFAQLFSDEDLIEKADKMELQTALRTGRCEDDRWHVKKDGSLFYSIGATNPVWDQSKNLIGYVKIIRDQTVRKVEYEHLEHHQKWLQRIFDKLPMGLVLIEHETGRTLFANQEAIDLGLGFAWDQFSENQYELYFGTDFKGERIPLHQMPRFRLARGERIRDLELVWNTPQGSVPLLVQGEQLPEMLGWPRAALYCLQDISERKRAENMVQAQMKILQTILDQLPIGVIIVENPKAKVTFFNPEAQRLVKHPLAAGASLFDLNQVGPVHDDHKPYLAEEIPVVRSLQNGETIVADEMMYRRGDGEFRHFLVSSAPVHNHVGEVIFAVTAFADIEQRKQMELQLKRSEEHKQMALRAAQVGIWEVNFQKNQVHYSPELGAMFGFPADTDCVSVTEAFDKINPEDRISMQDHFRESFRKTGLFKMEFRISVEGGNTRWILAQGEGMLDEQGEPERMVGTCLDITEQKNHEQELRNAKAESEAASRAKSQFLANMSHEIRTPIGVVQGFADLLLDSEGLTEEQRDWLTTIQRNTSQLTHIIGDILDLSKIEADKLEIDKVKFPLSEFLDEIRDVLAFKAQQKGLVFEIETEGKLPSILCTDPVRLRQILLNIAGNAIKFTENGSVKVLIQCLQPNSKSDHPQFVATVIDTGIGLNEEQKQRLFRPFSQGDNTTSRKFGGTGLGLVISRKLAKALGGDLKLLESQPGRGSTFQISMDWGFSVEEVGKEEGRLTANPKVETPMSPKLKGTKILLVEDSLDNQKLIEGLLTKHLACVDFASNGREGIEKAENGNYDLILMDIEMPVLNGHQAVQELRRRGYQKPILALSAHALKEERDQAVQEGFNDYFTKPIDGTALIPTIRRLVRNL